MTDMKKRLLSILLALCIVITILPIQTFASTTVSTWFGLYSAVSAAPTNGTETIIEIGASFNADNYSIMTVKTLLFKVRADPIPSLAIQR